MQLVNFVEGGERARMSKRTGEFVTLDELLDDIGRDAARFFLMQRSHDTALDLDLDLARSQSQENPVYYVQYAHARIASILRKAEAEGAVAGEPAVIAGAGDEVTLATACEPAERDLVDETDLARARGRETGAAPTDRLRDRGRGRLSRVLP